MILSLIIFGSLGWVLVLIFLSYMGIHKKKEVDYKVIHHSALFDGRVAHLYKSGIIKGMPVVSQEDLDVISQKIESGDDHQGGILAISIVEELSAKIEEGDFITVCKRFKSPAVITGDIKDSLELKGIECIDVSSLDTIGKGKIFIGQKVHAIDLKYGYRKATGLLSDGTIVEIEGKLPKKKYLTLDCHVESIFESSSFRKIWCKWENAG